MLRSILHITGLEQKLQAAKDRIEGQAQGLILQGKAVAIQMAIAASLAITAAILVLMALVAALIVLVLWLEPIVGSVAAIGMVAGGLLLVGIILAICAVTIGRKPTPAVTTAVAQPASTADIAAARMADEKIAPAGHEPLGFAEPPPARPVTADEVESLFTVAGQFARLPQTGIEPVDNVLRALAPKAEEATRDAVARAANMVRYGDRSTVLAILGTALAIGWAMTRVKHQSVAKSFSS
jgi:hypothetical protein